MTYISLFLMAIVSVSTARVAHRRFHSNRYRGQMDFKSTQQNKAGVTNPEPKLNEPADENEIFPIVSTMDNENTVQSIMDCLSNNCQTAFDECMNDTECKTFMTKYQQTKSLSNQCKNSDNSQCEYTDLFWNAYKCGVNNNCYNDLLSSDLSSGLSSNAHVIPSNFRRQPTNVTGSASKYDYTLILVAITSGISAVILVEICRRLRNGLKNRCNCNCADSLLYLKNRWDQIRGYKYEKTHGDLAVIEEKDDDMIYGDDSTDANGTSDVSYNGIMKSDSDDSDDIELQTEDVAATQQDCNEKNETVDDEQKDPEL